MTFTQIIKAAGLHLLGQSLGWFTTSASAAVGLGLGFKIAHWLFF